MSTYTVAAYGVTWAASKNMLALYNVTGSGKVIRVYRAWMLNNFTTAVTGVHFRVIFGRFAGAYSGGTAVSYIKHDTNNPDVGANIIAAHGPTGITISDIFGRISWSSDETAVGTAVTRDEFETIIALSLIGEWGYADSNIEPITLDPGYGFAIQSSADSVTHVSSADIFVECTVI